MILVFACGGSSSTGTPNSPFGEGFIWCAFFMGVRFRWGLDSAPTIIIYVIIFNLNLFS